MEYFDVSLYSRYAQRLAFIEVSAPISRSQLEGKRVIFNKVIETYRGKKSKKI